MTDATRFQFNNPSVPKAYNEFFVPRLFEPWAKVLLEGADLRRGESVLDVATGPGTVARLAAVRLGAEGRVVATDIAQPMLDIAKAKAPPGGAPIEYLNSPAAPLPAAAGAFDAVLCQQGLQFFPDRPAALREMRRVLKPGGRAAIAVWAELERNQIFASFHAALRDRAPAALAELIIAPFSWPSARRSNPRPRMPASATFVSRPPRCLWCLKAEWSRPSNPSPRRRCRPALPSSRKTFSMPSSPVCGTKWGNC